MKPSRAALVVTLLAGLSVAVVVACGDDAAFAICRNIPAGGCPRVADPCVDVTCEAVYVCQANASWRLDRTCPPHEPPDGRDAAPDVLPETDASDAAAARDVDSDVPGSSGGPGCENLEAPDCPLATALACPASSCCGCEDLFVCNNGGWELWGGCTGNGAITPKSQ